MKDHSDDWRSSCELASKENDPRKLLDLITRINRALEETHRRSQQNQVAMKIDTVLLPTGRTSQHDMDLYDFPGQRDGEGRLVAGGKTDNLLRVGDGIALPCGVPGDRGCRCWLAAGECLGCHLAIRDRHRRGSARFRVALQALQLTAQIGGALVAQITIFLQQAMNNVFQLLRQVRVQTDGWGRRSIQN